MSKAAASGVVALVFLVLGFQIAVFSGNVFKFGGERQRDTIVVHTGPEGTRTPVAPETVPRVPSADSVPFARQGTRPRDEFKPGDSRQIIGERVEAHRREARSQLFDFNPNTIPSDSLVLLGFSEKQAEVIMNYRNKGGRYGKPSDFARMYVVDSAMFKRLAPHIKIPKLDINRADSAALVALKGIGPFYASRILELRSRLGGVFSSVGQLKEIEGMDDSRFESLSSQIELNPALPTFSLWNASLEQLRRHPYIGSWKAKGIVRYKSVADSARWSIDDLSAQGVIEPSEVEKLRYLDWR
ncbi:MAG: helix-hairpin-helix domain-containing protein [Bacteroidales bacterium]|nr:helix-hairpin-helix domain-containing protein [Bacteroidales bacterium]